MYETILVPLDGSSRAEAVLPHVEALAARFDARVVFLTVDEPSATLDVDEVIEVEKYRQERREGRQRERAYLEGIRSGFGGKGIRSEARVTAGPVVEAIADAAVQEKADLIAMASHGWGGRSRAFYGSVSAGVLQRIDRPLFLIRSGGPA